jgi:hypothetical protein
MRRAGFALVLCLLPLSAAAQDQIRAADILGLADDLHRAPAALTAELARVAPQFRITRTRALDVPGDPFLALIDGAFGPRGGPRPAGLVHCARYGIETRDLLASHPASDPEIFPLFAALRVAGDDAAVWPEDAIALFRCIFTWDDARRIAPWPEAEVAALLADGFAEVIRRDDRGLGAATHYGAEGFRLDGIGGPEGSYYRVERLSVVRNISHQQVMLRVFLLGGGV